MSKTIKGNQWLLILSARDCCPLLVSAVDNGYELRKVL